ncbi:hypothetical protein BDE02_13G061600 [Populus trichocarpa]|jgi:hypothetical protein|nr:hypothetical protein BDE02_13G061600 [Populus trichocarpa]
MHILRPLSPHLPIYKPQLTSAFPIFRRCFFFFMRKGGIVSLILVYMTPLLFNWGLTWGAPFFIFFAEWIDFLLSSMEGFPLSIGGGGSDAGPSRRPVLDLNSTPQPELDLNQPAAHEQEPEPAPPLDDQDLLTKRKRVSEELRLLLQIGAVKRKNKIADQLLDWMGLDNETDRTLLDDLYNHLYDLSEEQGRRVGQPQMFSSKGIKSLKLWFLNRKER